MTLQGAENGSSAQRELNELMPWERFFANAEDELDMMQMVLGNAPYREADLRVFDEKLTRETRAHLPIEGSNAYGILWPAIEAIQWALGAHVLAAVPDVNETANKVNNLIGFTATW